MNRTFETKIKDTDVTPFFRDYASLYGRLSRKLFVDLIVKKKELNELKRTYIARYGIPGRIYNSIKNDIESEVKAYWALLVAEEKRKKEQITRFGKKIERAKTRLDVATRSLKTWSKIAKNVKSSKKRERALSKFYETVSRCKRDLSSFNRAIKKRESRLRKIAAIKTKGIPSILFGGRKRFSEQFSLTENGFKNSSEWKASFVENRDSDFFSIGSKGENAGNQNIQYDPLKERLTIVVPKALSHKYGKSIVLEGVGFSYGRSEITDSFLNNRSLTHRIKYRQDKKAWYLLTLPKASDQHPEIVTDRRSGVIGVDLNRHHVSVTEIDRYGNKFISFDVPMVLEGKTEKQRNAIIGDVVKQITDYALFQGKSLAIESLDFSKKKRSSKKGDPFTKFIMQFAYAKFSDFIRSASYRKGGEGLLLK